MGDTETYIRYLGRRVLRRMPAEESAYIPASEMKVIRMYSFVWIIGRIWAILMLLWVTVPVSVGYIHDLSRVFRTGYAADPAIFVDATLTSAIFLVPTSAGLLMWVRSVSKRIRDER